MSSNATKTTASKENEEVTPPVLSGSSAFGGNVPSFGEKNEDHNTFGGDGGGFRVTTPAPSSGSGDNSPATGIISFGNEGTGSSNGFGGNSGGFGSAATVLTPEEKNTTVQSSSGFSFGGSNTTSTSVASAIGGSSNNPDVNLPSSATGGFGTPSGGGFGSIHSNITSAFGSSRNGGGFGAANGGGFGSNQDNNTSAFGSNFGTTVAATTMSPSGFGGGGMFGTNTSGGNMFGVTNSGTFVCCYFLLLLLL
jgi:hypothetical protein